MKPAAFAYHRAASIDDALAQLNGGALARPLAGGQSLVPMLNLRLAAVDKLVDLSRITDLKQAYEQRDAIRYGAMLTHAAFEDRRVPDGSNGLMPHVGSQIAFRAVRTRGTIGGAVSLADPAADWVTALTVLEAAVAVAGPQGRRTLPMTEFVVGPYMTALGDGELIEALVVPRRPPGERWGHYKMSRKVGEYADSMAIALIDSGARRARLVAGATDGAPLVLAKAAEAVAAGVSGTELADCVRAELAASGRDFSPSDLHLHATACLRAVANARAAA